MVEEANEYAYKRILVSKPINQGLMLLIYITASNIQSRVLQLVSKDVNMDLLSFKIADPEENFDKFLNS